MNLTIKDLDDILIGFGMDQDSAQDELEIKATKDVIDTVKPNVYGLLTVASAFGQLPASYDLPLKTPLIIIVSPRKS
jgi:hypothetical protein